VNAWLVAAGALLVTTVPLWVVLLRADTVSRLVAMEVFGVEGSLVLLCLAEGLGRSPFADLAIVLAVVSMASGLTFARLVERYL
jgi:multisubunit Na+/H+ antiporter MnhF subunit